ncbi:hypothetical protein RJT34_09333 [Clitoria ternatea]|uniref:Uncharacterized protein n=1 Tax=Clitoria ternatea TaxID=43366 RepID=A0AAN9K5N6_CLITE
MKTPTVFNFHSRKLLSIFFPSSHPILFNVLISRHSLIIDSIVSNIAIINRNPMDDKKMYEAEPSPTFPSQFYPNTPEIFTRTFTNDSHSEQEIWCRCGHGTRATETCDQNDQIGNVLDEGTSWLVKPSKRMRITGCSENPTLMDVSEAELTHRDPEDAALKKKAPELSIISSPSGIRGIQSLPQRNMLTFADVFSGPSQQTQLLSILSSPSGIRGTQSLLQRNMLTGTDVFSGLSQQTQLLSILSSPSEIRGTQFVVKEHVDWC